jgi:hypothetical protein
MTRENHVSIVIKQKSNEVDKTWSNKNDDECRDEGNVEWRESCYTRQSHGTKERFFRGIYYNHDAHVDICQCRVVSGWDNFHYKVQ